MACLKSELTSGIVPDTKDIAVAAVGGEGRADVVVGAFAADSCLRGLQAALQAWEQENKLFLDPKPHTGTLLSSYKDCAQRSFGRNYPLKVTQ